MNINDYPAIQGWLLPFKEKLEGRATKQEWFELQQAQEAYVPSFKSPKISYIEVCRRGPFSLESQGYFQEGTTFLIPSPDKVLLALLNSNVAWFFFAGTATYFRGGYLRMKSQFVEQLPIPNMNGQQKEELDSLSEKAQNISQMAFSIQESFRLRILDLRPSDCDVTLSSNLKKWWTLTDFASFRAEVKRRFRKDIPLHERSAWEERINNDRSEVIRMAAEITRVESRIDSIVYELFGLTPDEISLLEGAIDVR